MLISHYKNNNVQGEIISCSLFFTKLFLQAKMPAEKNTDGDANKDKGVLVYAESLTGETN